MRCNNCQTHIPDEALFCIECGASQRAATGVTTQLPQATVFPKRCPSCGASNPQAADFCMICAQPLGRQLAPVAARSNSAPIPASRRTSRLNLDHVAGFLFLVGLALLFFSRSFWPGILVLVGVTSFISALARGRLQDGIGGLIWMLGLAFLFAVPKLFFPGILVLIALSMVLHKIFR
jgi:hypothetical protein